jgi:hypothetical protein
VGELARNGIGELLKKTAWAKSLVEWLHEETGVSKWKLTITVKLLSFLVTKAAEKSGGGVAAYGGKLIGEAFGRTSTATRIAQALSRIDRTKAAQIELEAVIGGTIRPEDATRWKDLPLTERTQFVTLDRLAKIQDQLNPQPHLHVALEPDTDENRFLFAARRMEFLGREQEMDALTRFLSAPGPFTWWTIGGPGGAGKSRLALELCLHAAGAWRIGFVRKIDEFDWSQWRPAHPTVLIADYADQQAEEIGEVARILMERADAGGLDMPVRLLLIVRDPEAAWKTRFLGWGTRQAVINRARHADAMLLRPLSDDDVWRIILSFLPADVPPPDRGETLSRLTEIDPARRPLFAAFAGDAIAHGRDLRGWDQRELVRNVLEREEKLWESAGVTDADKNLLALATLTGGLSTEALAGLRDSLFPPAQSDGYGREGFEPERFRAMTGIAATETLSPLLPDILGELFVLEHLAAAYQGDDVRASTLRDLAWKLGPAGMFSFLSRTAADFPSHATLEPLGSPARGDELQRRAWAMAVVNMTHAYGAGGKIDNAVRTVRDITTLSDAYPDDLFMREQRAAAAFNLVTAYGNAGRIEDAQEIYAELRALSEAYPGEAALRERWAEAALNLMTFYGNASRSQDALETFSDLRALSEAYPDEAALRERRAKAAFNLVTACGSAGHFDEARGVYLELRALSEAYPADVPVREQRGMAAVNLVSVYGNAGRVDNAQELYSELRTLSEAYPDEPAVREQRARAAVNLVSVCGNASRFDKAQELYSELRALSEAYPDEPAVREQRARAAVNLVSVCGNADRFEEARGVYLDLRALSEAYPAESTLRERRAKTAFNIVTVCGNAGHFDEAREVYLELRALYEAYRADGPVRDQRANAAFNLATDYGNAGRLDNAQELYSELCALSQGYPAEASLRERRAMAAVNIGAAYGNAGRVHEAQGLYSELRTLCEAYPEAALRELRAQAAFNLVTTYGNAGGVEEALGIYSELRALSDCYPTDATARESQGKAAVNLMAAYGNAGRVEEAQEIYWELRALSEAYPAEAAVREQRTKALFNSIVYSADAAAIDETRSLCEELKALAEEHPDDQIVQECWTRAFPLIPDTHHGLDDEGSHR